MEKKQAMELVEEYEKKQGRNPERVNKFREGYDLKSGDRFIDVKIGTERDKDLLLSLTKFKKLGKNIINYYVYLVIEGEKPKLKILEPEFLLRNFKLLTLMNVKGNSLRRVKAEEL
ncbi:MAG: DUF3883 domain-containing protein [Candidatus Pacearchaeota archaeon]